MDGLTCKVIRVTAPDTLMCRIGVPQIAGETTMYVRLFGVDCTDAASEAVVDWVELHGQGSIELLILDWLRDPYGRLLGDLSNGGEHITEYLCRIGAATPRPDHHAEVVAELMSAPEPEA